MSSMNMLMRWSLPGLMVLVFSRCALPTTCETADDCLPPANFCDPTSHRCKLDENGGNSNGSTGGPASSGFSGFSATSGFSGGSSSGGSSSSTGGAFVFPALADQTVDEDMFTELEVPFPSAQGRTLLSDASVTLGENPLGVDASEFVLSVQPTDPPSNLRRVVFTSKPPDFNGTFDVHLRAHTDVDPEVTASFRVTVNPVDDPYTALPPPVMHAVVGTPSRVTFTDVRPGPVDEMFTNDESLTSVTGETISIVERPAMPGGRFVADITLPQGFNAPALDVRITGTGAAESATLRVPVKLHTMPQVSVASVNASSGCLDVTVLANVENGLPYDVELFEHLSEESRRPLTPGPARAQQRGRRGLVGTGIQETLRFSWDAFADLGPGYPAQATIRARLTFAGFSVDTPNTPVALPVRAPFPPTYMTRTQLSSVAGTRALKTAYLNHDDVVDTVLLRGNGMGQTIVVFTPEAAPMQTSFMIPDGSAGLVLGDLNGDARPDILTIDDGMPSRFRVVMNATVGVQPFSGAPSDVDSTLMPGPVRKLALADVNSDGMQDILLIQEGASDIFVFMNRTIPGSMTAAFGQPSRIGLMRPATAIAALDFSLDGRIDFAVVDGTGVLTPVINTTQFGASEAFGMEGNTVDLIVPTSGYLLLAEDLDLDGRDDLVAVRDSADVLVVHNTGDGSGNLSLEVLTQDIGTATGLASGGLADVDDDGLVDLVLVLPGMPAFLRVLSNTGVLSTSSPAFRPLPAVPLVANGNLDATLLGLGDVTHDGRVDAILFDMASASVVAIPQALTGGRCNPGLVAPRVTLPLDSPGAIDVEYVTLIADLNADAIPDMVQLASGKRDVRKGLGDGRFEARLPSSAPPAGPMGQRLALAAGRVSTDNRSADLLALNGSLAYLYDNNSVAPELGITDVPTRTFSLGSGTTLGAFMLDVNGDGREDLVVMRAEGLRVSTAPSELGEGAEIPEVLGFGDPVVDVEPADLDLDGRLDFILARRTEVLVARNTTLDANAPLRFEAPRTLFTSPVNVQAVTAGDFDGDHDVDIALLGAGNGLRIATWDGTGWQVGTVMLSDVEAIAAAQLDGDDGSELVAVLTESGRRVIRLINFSGTSFDQTSDVAGPVGGFAQLLIADADGDARPDVHVVGGRGVVVSVPVVAPPGAQAAFARPYNVGSDLSGSNRTVVTDLNLDGRPDLVVSASDGARLLRNQLGNEPPFNRDQTISVVGRSWFAADVTLDGRPDILESDGTNLTVHPNTSTPRNSLSVGAPFGGGFPGIMRAHAAELNLDGKTDLVGFNSDGIRVALNQTPPGGPLVDTFDAGAGTFELVTTMVTGLNTQGTPLFDDANGDGRTDVIAGQSGVLKLFRNTSGDGGVRIEELGVDVMTAQPPYQALLADVDGDRLKDVVVLGTVAPFTVVHARADGFVGAERLTLPAPPMPLDNVTEPVVAAAGDVDGDGRDDLVLAHGASGIVGLGFSRGTAGMQLSVEWQLYQAAPDITELHLADFNGDGWLDVLTVSSGGVGSQVLLGR